MLAKHRSVTLCASCHNKIDPPGFALESFDVIGGWQTQYRSLGEGKQPPKELTGGRGVGYKVAQTVDAAGETSDGRPFKDIEGFKQLILTDPKPVARNLAAQLLTYATGAPVAFTDRPAFEQILERAAPSEYGLRTLVHEIVESGMFLSK